MRVVSSDPENWRFLKPHSLVASINHNSSMTTSDRGINRCADRCCPSAIKAECQAIAEANLFQWDDACCWQSGENVVERGIASTSCGCSRRCRISPKNHRQRTPCVARADSATAISAEPALRTSNRARFTAAARYRPHTGAAEWRRSDDRGVRTAWRRRLPQNFRLLRIDAALAPTP